MASDGPDGRVEYALEVCGRDRVFHNSGAKPSIAIRWLPMQVPPVEKWIVAEGETHNEAGEKAARVFAERLLDEAKRLKEHADRIIRTLAVKS